MDFLRRRERCSTLNNLIDLRRRYDEDDDDDEEYHQRRKEYCLIKVRYQNPNPRRRRKIDEIMIIQHDHVVFKGCLKVADQFTFKSQRYRNASRIKLNFYINDFLEETMTACCEHGLIDRNRPEHFFQIEKIIGTKPCHNCELDDDDDDDDDTPAPSTSHIKQTSAPEDPITPPKPKEKKPTSIIREISTNHKAPSEGFSADLAEVSDHPNRHESEEDSADVVPPLPSTPLKPRYGPPQLSVIETPSPGVRQSPLSGLLFSSTTNTEPQTEDQPVRTEPVERQSSAVETTPNNIAAAADATQLLLQRLGITRQEQVERSSADHVIPPREKGNVEDLMLIYLHDSDPDESTMKSLRHLVNFVKTFNDGDDCIAFINTITSEKIILIVSHSFHQSALPRIEELQQILMIYILLENADQASDIPSGKMAIRGAFTSFDDMYARVSDDINKITRDLLTYLTVSSKSTSIPSPVFYYLLLTEIILEKTETKDDMKELIRFSRQEYEGNDEELKLIDEFENSYKKNDAIAWLSRSCFMSKILSKSLRALEPDILYRFRSFLQDVSQQMQEEPTSESLTIYLGQTIGRSDFDKLQKNILTNDLLLWPQFLSGTTDQDRAIRIAKGIPLLDADVTPLLIRIDLFEEFKCAAFIFPRYSNNEDNNVLLNMGSFVRIVRVEKEDTQDDQMAFLHLRAVKLEEQENIQHIIQTHHAEIKSFSAFTGMIKLMMQMNQQPAAEQLVQTMIDDENFKSDVNFQGALGTACLILGQEHRTKGEFQLALDLFLLSIQVFQRIVLPTAEELSPIYACAAGMYFRVEDYDHALEYYQKALDTQLQATTPDIYTIGSFTKSIAVTYVKQKKYPEGIKYFERTLKILAQCPNPQDAELVSTYDDLAETYLLVLKIDEAIENYTKALEIQERIEPPEPQTLGRLNNTLGNIYLKLGRSKEALAYLKRGLEYCHELLPPTHATLALLYNNVGLMYYREGQHEEALRCYAKVLEIGAVSLPDNNSLVGVTLFNMGLCYSSQERYDEAIESIEKSTVQFLKSLPPDHSDILENKKYIETMQQKKALKEIFQENTTTF